jgi:hypothetical protein
MQFNFTGFILQAIAPKKLGTVVQYGNLRRNKRNVFDGQQWWCNGPI